MDVRNKVWMWRSDRVWTSAEKWWWASLATKGALEYLQFNRWRPRAWMTVLRGLRDGIVSAPGGTSARS